MAASKMNTCRYFNPKELGDTTGARPAVVDAACYPEGIGDTNLSPHLSPEGDMLVASGVSPGCGRSPYILSPEGDIDLAYDMTVVR